MAITANWSVDPTLLGALVQETGAAERKRHLDQEALANERYQLDLEERQREYDLGLGQRASEGQSQRAVQLASLQARAQENDQNAARQMALAGMQQQGSLQREQLQQQGLYDRQQLTLDTAGAGDLNKAADARLAEVRKTQLDPFGTQKLLKLQNDLRAIQESYGTQVRPQQYNSLMRQWFDNFEQANLAQYKIEEPTPEEWFGKTTFVAPDGTVYGKDRNGTPRKLKDPPPRIPSDGEIEANIKPLPNGGAIFFNPHTGQQTVIPPEKPAGAQKHVKGTLDPDGKVPIEDYDTQFEAARKRLIDRATLEVEKDAEGKDKPIKAPTFDEVEKELDEFNERKRKRYFGAQQNGQQGYSMPADWTNANPSPQQLVAPQSSKPPVEITGRQDADALAVGDSFVFNGQLFIKTGPGQAEPVEMQ